MNRLIGFLIALAVGLTGIGGGSFTVPALVLLAGLAAGGSCGNGFLVCRRAALDCSSLLRAREAVSSTLPAAPAAWRRGLRRCG
jgi:hypothetical protein